MNLKSFFISIKYLASYIAVLLATNFSTLFLYLKNADKMNFVEIAGPLIVFSLIAISLTIVSGIFLKSVAKAAVLVSIAMFIFTNYALLE